mmetsp:Transcript_8686/g.17621  ORF Transcript_8686/g.17621 Transcript_8686/m.17621 type:complete len:205 (+) Transcript_8686:1746-2360(+)
MSEAQANLTLSLFEIFETYQCWVSKDGNSKVSLSTIDFPDTTGPLVVCVLLTAVSAITWAGLLALFAFAILPTGERPYDSSSDSQDISDHDGGPEYPAPPPVTKPNRRMKTTQIAKIMSEFQATAPPGEWYCSICLEERVGEVAMITLPCSHSFDASCLSLWLKRGHKCPLCLQNLRSLFDTTGKELIPADSRFTSEDHEPLTS